MRLYKAMFKKYAVVSNTKVQMKKFTFEGLQEQQNTMSLQEVYAFMNDFKLFGFKKLKRDDIQKIIKMINAKNKDKFANQNLGDLDLQGFIDFLLQIGHFIFDKNERPMTFMCLLHRHMKSVSLASNK